jgi:hypothetical protein
MKKKYFIILIIVVLIFAMIIGFLYFLKARGVKLNFKQIAYHQKLISECVNCYEGRTYENKPCCNDNFKEECSLKNGIIRTVDLHPVFPGAIFECYEKAFDAGRECASSFDCSSNFCVLSGAITSNKCSLIEKKFTGEENEYSKEKFYTATYSCNTTKPGVCASIKENANNPGGQIYSFQMDKNNNKILIESLTSGPIN